MNPKVLMNYLENKDRLATNANSAAPAPASTFAVPEKPWMLLTPPAPTVPNKYWRLPTLNVPYKSWMLPTSSKDYDDGPQDQGPLLVYGCQRPAAPNLRSTTTRRVSPTKVVKSKNKPKKQQKKRITFAKASDCDALKGVAKSVAPSLVTNEIKQEEENGLLLQRRLAISAG